MNLTIDIKDLPPMPRNRSHQIVRRGKGFMSVKVDLAHEFEKDLTNRLQEYKHAFNDFKNLCSDDHYISALYTIWTPYESLFTQEGRVSLRAVDTDAHKVMRDTLYRCIGLDDKLERDTRFFTPASHDGKWNYTITLKLEKICNLKTPSLILNLEESASLL